jgi:hypothetical protein
MGIVMLKETNTIAIPICKYCKGCIKMGGSKNTNEPNEKKGSF